jgi:hypothetical protein
LTETTKQILEDLQAVVQRCATGNPSRDGSFISSIRAAFAKNFEVNAFIQSHRDPVNAFAITSALRGLCEDIIVLKFLATFTTADRDEAVGVLALKSTLEFMQEQTAFFTKYRPSQPILEAGDVSREIQGLKLRLRAFRKSYPWKKHREWPSVREMAALTDLLPLYNFVYAATSQFVHYSPRNLLRMGRRTSPTGKTSYSTSHLADYYNAFNRFYGPFLLITFCTTFAHRLACVDDVRPAVEKLMRHLDEELRWPELVTMEELDLPTVAPALRMMAHRARKIAKPPAVWKWEENP